MRKRLILHIGMHKTGSSAIQRFLSLNRAALARLGVVYPASYGADGERLPKHADLSAAISHEADHGGAPHPAYGAAAEVIDRLSDEIQAARGGTAVISAEGLSGERRVFAEATRPLADRFDVRVVMFARRRDRWVESFYRQMVRSREVRETRPFHAFLEAPETRRHLDYLRIAGWWAEAFGDGALKLGTYAPGGPPPVRAFLALADLSPRLAWLPFARGRVNPSNSVEATELARLATIRGASLSAMRLSDIEAALTERTTCYLTRAERAAFLDDYAADDQALAARFRLPSPLFSADPGSSRAATWTGFAADDPRLGLIDGGGGS